MVDLKMSLDRQAERRKAKILGEESSDTGTDSITVNGYEVNIVSAKSCLLGLAVGLQMNDDTFGSCATTALDQIDVLN
jgi:hypothetical protein